MKVAIICKIHQDGLDFLKSQNIEVIEINDFDENIFSQKISDVEGIIIRTAQLKEYSDDIYDINKHCEERLSFYLERTEEFNEAQMNMIAQYVDYNGE